MVAALTIDPDHQRLADDFAAQFGLSGKIHPKDYIYWYDFDLAPEDGKHLIAQRYMEGGRATAAIVAEYLRVHPVHGDAFSILDFASGYGRMARWLGQALPNARIVASDIHPEAVAFMESLGIEAFLSCSDPREFTTPQRFDVIWALSFFTHMPKHNFQPWLRALAGSLNEGGLLLFTTHGLPIWPLLGRPVLDEDGFWFVAGSEQKDLDTAEYGNTCTTPTYVMSQIEGLDLRVEGLRSPGIGHHDVWAMRRVRPDEIFRRTIEPRRQTSSGRWRLDLGRLMGRK